MPDEKEIDSCPVMYHRWKMCNHFKKVFVIEV